MVRRDFITLIAIGSLTLIGCGNSTPWRGLRKIGLVQSFHGPNPNDSMATHIMIRDTIIEQNQLGGTGGIRLELVSLDDEANVAALGKRITELLADPLMHVILVRSDAPNSAIAPARVPILLVSDFEAARRALFEYLKNST